MFLIITNYSPRGIFFILQKHTYSWREIKPLTYNKLWVVGVVVWFVLVAACEAQTACHCYKSEGEMFNCVHKIFCFVRSAYKTLHVARRRFMPLAFHVLKRVTCFALVLFCKLARLIIDLFVNCLHKKQHQLRCLMGEHSWCIVYEIRAICAVIYGVLAFTPPPTNL